MLHRLSNGGTTMTNHEFTPQMRQEREKQLTQALLDNEGICYDINFTQNCVLGRPVQVINGVTYDVLERMGKPAGCTYTDIVEYWASRLPSEEGETYRVFADTAKVLARYAAGERVLKHRCWSTDVLGNPMMAEITVRLYPDCQNGDILGFVYVSNAGETELLRRKEARLAKEYTAASNRATFLEFMAKNLPGGYHRCSVDDGFKLSFVSDSFLDIVGWTREEIETELDNRFINLVYPEDRELFMSYEPTLAATGYISLDYRIQRKDGTCRWVQDVTQHVEQDGERYYQCILLDITESVQQRKEMARRNLELTQAREQLEIIEQNMPSGYHRCKAEAGCPLIYVGEYFCRIVGFTREEIERDFGNLYINLIWPEDASVISTYEDMIAMRGKGNRYDTSVYRVKHRDGGYRWVTDSTMFVDLGEDSFFQATLADITEYIEGLNKAREQAEASSRAKTAFLFNASHDIRTPLNAIQGFSHIIEANARDHELVLESVRKLRQSSDVLLTLMNDVLELSRIERGKETVCPRPVDMRAHVEKLQEMMLSDMTADGIHFVVENDIQHPLVLADDLKMTRIAMNLLSNARKFTPRGGRVTFGVRETGYDGEKANYGLYVRDTGIGMSEEFQQRAFEQFERERSSTESGIAGSGLGLAIIKSLADLLGGVCSIRSKQGEGTEITCTVPLPIAREEDRVPEISLKDVNFAGKRMLLVEDNDFNREIGRYVFEEAGFTVEEAINGVNCLEKLIQSPRYYYDLIMMDIQMPIMDGYTATAEIRRHSDPAIARIPIIAMTANAFEEDRQKCFDVGMNGHIGKPLEIMAVLKELTRVLPG